MWTKASFSRKSAQLLGNCTFVLFYAVAGSPHRLQQDAYSKQPWCESGAPSTAQDVRNRTSFAIACVCRVVRVILNPGFKESSSAAERKLSGSVTSGRFRPTPSILYCSLPFSPWPQVISSPLLITTSSRPALDPARLPQGRRCSLVRCRAPC